MGCYPIAQLREPYSTIQFLAERLNLVKLLNLQHPESGENEWSAIDICDSKYFKYHFVKFYVHIFFYRLGNQTWFHYCKSGTTRYISCC